MKAAEMIETLRRMPPDAEVFSDDGASLVTGVEEIDDAVVLSCETDRQRKGREMRAEWLFDPLYKETS